jgi:hypothetical protein
MKYRRLVMVALAGVISLAVVALLGINAIQSGRAEEPEPILKMPTYPPTPTVAPAPANAPSVAGAAMATFNFDTADALTRWQIIDEEGIPADYRSVWDVEDGALIQNRTADAGNPNLQETMAVTGDTAWSDYTISAKVYDQKNATFGLVARRQGNSYYRFRILANRYPDTPKQILEKVVNGVATPLVTNDTPGYDQRVWHTVSLTVAGSHISVKFDGKVVVETDDTSLASGQAGLYTRALGSIRFDDVVIARP